MTKLSRRVFYSSAARSSTHPQRELLLVQGDAFYSSVVTSSTHPRRGLLLGHDEAESEGLLLVHSETSRTTTTKPSRRVFYSSAARPPAWLWRNRVRGSSTSPRRGVLLVRGKVFCSSAGRLVLRYDEAESGLPLVCGEVFHFAAVRPPTRP